MPVTTAAASGPPPQTRERLLDAAELLFAARGFDAASVREITAEAGCNVAAVNYHFGSKEKLYRETFQRRLTTLREHRLASLRRVLEERNPTLDGVLRAFTGAFLEPLVDGESGSRMLDLMSRELVERRLPPGLFHDEMIEPTIVALTDALRRVVPGLDAAAARLCGHSIVGQLAHAVQLRRLAGGQRSSLLAGTSFVEHVVRFSAAGIRAFAKGGAR